MADMMRSLGGVETKLQVTRFCRVLLCRLGHLSVEQHLTPQALSVWDSDSVRAYLVTRNVDLEGVLGDDWETARLGGIEHHWRKTPEDGGSLYFVGVSEEEIPRTGLQRGTAYRLSTDDSRVREAFKEDSIVLTTTSDSIVLVYPRIDQDRLPRPEMELPYVEECWMALVAAMAATEEVVLFRDIALSAAFHSGHEADVVLEQSVEIEAHGRLTGWIDQAGLVELRSTFPSTQRAIQRRVADERTDCDMKEGSFGSLIEGILGQWIYAREDTEKLRYLRLWQGLVDAAGTNKLDNVAELKSHDPKRLDKFRNKFGHPAGLRRGDSSKRALLDLRNAALAWVRNLQ
ncbi:MAG: hypothetical protein F4000_08870 [Holophagales bacterium]|nr:hypothetical protein [Holophagales bacterium]